MKAIQINDSYISTVFETQFHNDKDKFIQAVKSLFQSKSKVETQEYNLLKAYSVGDLSIGQVSSILNISKNETINLLQKYDIPVIEIDKDYLQQEFNAFN